MKGSMFRALEEMTVKNYGRKRWESALEYVGKPRNYRFSIQENVEEGLWDKIMRAVAMHINKTVDETQKEFGDYWIKEYTEKLYGAFYMGAKTTRDFIGRLDFVHLGMTRDIEGATPPRFNYEWESDMELIMEYSSDRGLLGLMMDYLKSLDEKMGCHTKMEQIAPNKLRLIFDK